MKLLSNRNLIVFFFCQCITLFFRLPYFFPAVINWDESTFILMGQSILKGALPYVEYWDVKPPLAFVPFSVFIALSHRSIELIRFFGSIYIGTVVFMTYLIARLLFKSFSGILAALLCSILICFLEGAHSISVEHLALLPLLGAIFLYISKKNTTVSHFFMGALLSASVFIRPNLVYPAAAVFFSLLLKRVRLKFILFFCAGGLTIFLFNFLPYVFNGYTELWWNSVVTASLNYSKNQLSPGWIAKLYLKFIQSIFLSANSPLWACAIIILVGSALSLLKVKYFKKTVTILVTSTVVALSILKSGAAWIHYLIQLAPFLSILCSNFFVFLNKKKSVFILIAIAVFVLIRPLQFIGPEYASIYKKMQSNQPLKSGIEYAIAAKLEELSKPNDSIFLLDYQIVYWLLDKKPPTPESTHPSNIGKEYLLKAIRGPNFTVEQELETIFLTQPTFIVTSENMWLFSKNPLANALFEKKLSTNYHLVSKVETAKVFKINQ